MFVEHPKLDLCNIKSYITFLNLVTPKARAKFETMHNNLSCVVDRELELSMRLCETKLYMLLPKSMSLAVALGVTIFTTISAMNLVTLCCAAQV